MKKTIFISLLAFASAAFAGGESVGGGDTCEMRVQEIREDLRSWILKGGSEQLQNLPVSTKEYSNKMLEVLKTTAQPDGSVQPSTNIECTDQVILVQGIEKTCRFERSQSILKITCNNERFLNKNLISEEEQYRLVHHEYAGLAGLENPHNSQSSYMISDQIASFLETQTVKRLVAKPATEELLFVGVENASGKTCTVSLAVQNPEAHTYTVVYRAGEKTLHFYNQVLKPDQKIQVKGLFKKHDSYYKSEIGAPIFPVGNYHHVLLTQLPEGFRTETKIKLAVAVGWVSVSSTTDLCVGQDNE